MLGLRISRNPPWLFNCCVSPPQSEFGRLRVDRSLISAPSDFRHIGHVGAGDNISTADEGNAMGALLRSKGGPEFGMDVSVGLRSADVPIENRNDG
uniref:CRIB domain-containing protein n=2 Tax=Globodera TaxID=31242 RepID=A0A914HE54_GLORO